MFRFVLLQTPVRRAVALRGNGRRLRLRVGLRRAFRRARRIAPLALQHALLAPVIVASLLVFGIARLVGRALEV